jgi:hypothetical protein
MPIPSRPHPLSLPGLILRFNRLFRLFIIPRMTVPLERKHPNFKPKREVVSFFLFAAFNPFPARSEQKILQMGIDRISKNCTESPAGAILAACKDTYGGSRFCTSFG